eukprot:471941-Hanusia_phi.AAC.1
MTTPCMSSLSPRASPVPTCVQGYSLPLTPYPLLPCFLLKYPPGKTGGCHTITPLARRFSNAGTSDPEVCAQLPSQKEPVQF